MFDFNGKTVLVTGGNRGIGKHIALAFAEHNAHVIVTARNRELLEGAVEEIRSKGGRADYQVCDMADKDHIYRLVDAVKEKWGATDILVNNAGINTFLKKSEEVDEEWWDPIMRVNVMAPFILCREFGKLMLERQWGRIINIASVGGLIGLPRQVAYCASKGALIQMTRVLAVEWAARGVTVNAIAPGYIETDLTSGMVASEKISQNLLARKPIRRFGQSEEIASAAIYLADETSGFTTGSVLLVDGGMTAS